MRISGIVRALSEILVNKVAMAANSGLICYDPETVVPYPTELDLSEVPLTALRQKVRAMLSAKLNPPKILLTEEGLPRDWRGILHCARLNHGEANLVHSHPNPMASVLKLWCDAVRDDGRQGASFAQLIAALEVIDRFDVADDIKETLEEDAKAYIINKHTTLIQSIPESTKPPRTANSEEDILTVHDVDRSSQNLPPQIYDAFILFADEDIDFATELIERMEDCGLRLCVKERDLVGGISFEHEAILRLISERCNRLVVIFSPAFLESAANTFFVNYAQALGIEQKRRKIIPCVYKKCEIPATLNYSFLLKYERSGRLFNFWEKLRDTIRDTRNEGKMRFRLALPSITITEVDSPTSTIGELTPSEASDVDLSRIGTPSSISSFSQPAQNITVAISDENHNPQTPEPVRPRIMPPPPLLRSSESMNSLANTPQNGTLKSSLNGSAKSLHNSKKMKWLNKLLSPRATSDNALSASNNVLSTPNSAFSASTGALNAANNNAIITNSKTKTKTKSNWFRRKLATYS